MKNMYVNHVDMYMIQKLVIRITESLLELLLKISRRIGYARSAELEKMNLQKRRNHASSFFSLR